MLVAIFEFIGYSLLIVFSRVLLAALISRFLRKTFDTDTILMLGSTCMLNFMLVDLFFTFVFAFGVLKNVFDFCFGESSTYGVLEFLDEDARLYLLHLEGTPVWELIFTVISNIMSFVILDEDRRSSSNPVVVTFYGLLHLVRAFSPLGLLPLLTSLSSPLISRNRVVNSECLHFSEPLTTRTYDSSRLPALRFCSMFPLHGRLQHFGLLGLLTVENGSAASMLVLSVVAKLLGSGFILSASHVYLERYNGASEKRFRYMLLRRQDDQRSPRYRMRPGGEEERRLRKEEESEKDRREAEYFQSLHELCWWDLSLHQKVFTIVLDWIPKEFFKEQAEKQNRTEEVSQRIPDPKLT